MAENLRPNDRLLFHLVPANEAAEEALQHPDNQRFVSPSTANLPGLEIGFHVPAFSRGHVIARLGRNTDLILRQSYSAVHVAFEIHPETLLVMLSVRTKRLSSVKVAAVAKGAQAGQEISGDCAILYGQEYNIAIASYEFQLLWRGVAGPDPIQILKDLAISGYRDSMLRLKDVRSRDLSLPDSSTPVSWYMTRLQSAKTPLVKEADPSRVRELIGEGAFGKVYRTVDLASGNYFAVKVVELGPGNVELARAALHKEIKILERLSHEHIIECLGTNDFHTGKPQIFMPLCQGSLASLVEEKGSSHRLCNQVLQEMLSALDYLAFSKLCHRDVKPPNILYQTLDQKKYHFQLADFGLANDYRRATTFCGTGYYQAPELYTTGQPQTPKMDVWSLFATIIEVHPDYEFPPADARSYNDVLRAVQSQAALTGQLAPMARIDPTRRASAAQMLVRLFSGHGLTTPRNTVPDLEPDDPAPTDAQISAAAAAQARTSCAASPLGIIQYLHRHRQPPRPAPAPGMLPNRIPPKSPAGQQQQRQQQQKQPAIHAHNRLAIAKPGAGQGLLGQKARCLQEQQLLGNRRAGRAPEKKQQPKPAPRPSPPGKVSQAVSAGIFPGPQERGVAAGLQGARQALGMKLQQQKQQQPVPPLPSSQGEATQLAGANLLVAPGAEGMAGPMGDTAVPIRVPGAFPE